MASSWNQGHSTSSAHSPSSVAHTSASRRRQQSRQLLSCTKCRERKVKCDRLKPCTACCARGFPGECQFVVGEGNDYSPIQQSYEIRHLRSENQRLKERLQAAGLSLSDDEGDDGNFVEGYAKPLSRAAAVRQRRFKTSDRTDSIYFGSPGLATIIDEFAKLQVGSHSLAHSMPKGREMYPVQDLMYPFPILAGNTILEIIRCLPKREELYACLETFQQRAQSCYFPHVPVEVTHKEVDRFLESIEDNATKCPDVLALIFATLAVGLQLGVYDRSGKQWVADMIQVTAQQSDVYLAASVQALRLASFMNSPTLACVQTLTMIGPYLTNSGRFLDAFTLFGTTIRLAHSIGLHRNPKFLDPVPPLRESMIRQTLWWWMLHMDQQYSVTLGRPLGISGLGDCPPPTPLTTSPSIKRLGDFFDDFTVHARQILSSDGMMNVVKIDEFTDRLIKLWDTMPEALQFNESWLRQETVLPDWPLEVMSADLFAKVQSFLVLLNRQRVERTQNSAMDNSSLDPTTSNNPRHRNVFGESPPHASQDAPAHHAPIRGRALVINSSIHLIQIFLFFHHRQPAAQICWSIGQQAFNASMILILDAWETENEQNEWWINQAYVVFCELDKKGVHKIAQLAVQRISAGLSQLGSRRAERERAAALFRRNDSATAIAPSSQATQMATFISDFGADADAMDLVGDTVMGNTGMFLLEDPGLQSLDASAFQPFTWPVVPNTSDDDSGDNLLHTTSSGRATPQVPSPTIPVSNVTIAPFPVMSPPFIPTAIPLTNSPFALGLQPRMIPAGLHPHAHTMQYRYTQSQASDKGTFTPINHDNMAMDQSLQAGPQTTADEQAVHSYMQSQRGAAHERLPVATSGESSRGVHRLDRAPKSRKRSGHRGV